MTSDKSPHFSTVSKILGLKNRETLALYGPAQIYRRVRDAGHELGWSEVQALHAEAKKDYDHLRILEKSLFTRVSPLLPAAIRLGLKHPDSLLRDYEEWFGRELKYAVPGEASSMFSPVAYLTELYREARTLYGEGDDWHIDTRRPDLAKLLLSQENMDEEVTALSLSNEILMERMRKALETESIPIDDDVIMQTLAEHVISSGTPFHLHHSRLRQVCLQKDPEFSQMLEAPRVIWHLNVATMAGVYYAISPALYRLLTDEITEENAEGKFTEYFGEGIAPENFLNLQYLQRWYGLTVEEADAFVCDVTSDKAQYIDNMLTTQVGGKRYSISWELADRGDGDIKVCRIYPQGGGVWLMDFMRGSSSNYPYARFYINKEDTSSPTVEFDSFQFGDEFFDKETVYTIPFLWADGDISNSVTSKIQIKKSTGSWYSYEFEFTIETHPNYPYFLKLNKQIRLYKAAELPLRVLADIINSANQKQINVNTLNVLFRTAMLMKHYYVSHEDALVMSTGLISQKTVGVEKSQWDRLFNSPPLVDGGFTPGGEAIDFDPSKASEQADIKATLKRAFQTNDEGLYALQRIHDSSATTTETPLTLKFISDCYALSLWGRSNHLSPVELRQILSLLGLPSKLSDEQPSVWIALFQRLQATVNWLRTHNWTVTYLVLLTRDVAGIPSGSEIKGLLASLRTAAGAATLPDEPQLCDYAFVLSPPLAATLDLPGEELARTLLTWSDAATPGGKTLAQFWNILIKDEPDANESTALTTFAYSLAQMALIVHATGVNQDALYMFVCAPERLSATAEVEEALGRSIEVIMALGQFSEWLKTLSDAAGAGAAVVSSLKAGELTPALLAQATGIPLTVVVQAAAEAMKKQDIKDDDKLSSWQEIGLVLEWITLSKAFGVMPSDMGKMMTMDYLASTPPDWDDWKSLGNVFSASLSPAQQRAAEDNLSAGLSGALSGWLLAESKMPNTSLSNREMLFNYLLSDNLNGPQVQTSRIAEAITSLQIFIHRVLNLAPPDAEAVLVKRESLDRPFFRDWTQWNARYSTWAGGQKLMYYPENYIDPTVRLGQTHMMGDMLQVLGQAQINTDTVGDAFMGYLTGFEEVANLETLNGYHDSNVATAGKKYFVGRDQLSTPGYWFRSLDEGKRGSDGQLPANAWTGWSKITAAPQPVGRLIRPVVYKERLYLGWVERNRHVTARNDKGEETAWEHRWELKMSWLRYDGGWSQPAVYTYPKLVTEKLETLAYRDAEELDSLSLYLASNPSRQLMMAAIYEKGAGVEKDAPLDKFTGEVIVFEDMTFDAKDFVEANWIYLSKLLDEGGQSKVLLPFIRPDIYVQNELTLPSELPPTFTSFDASEMKASVTDIDETASTYKLSVSVKLTVNKSRSSLDKEALRFLVENFPQLRNVATPIKAVYTNHSYAGMWIMNTADEWWAYMVFPVWNRDIVLIRDANINSVEYSEVKKDLSGQGYFARFRVRSEYVSDLTLLIKGPETLAIPSNVTSLFFPYEFQGAVDVPASYNDGSYFVVPGNEVKFLVKGPASDNDSSYEKSGSYDLSGGPLIINWVESTFPVQSGSLFNFSGDEIVHDLCLQCGNGSTRTWKFRVFKREDVLAVDLIGVLETNGQRAQYLEHDGTRTRLNTLFARQLTESAARGIDAILNFNTQKLPEPPLKEDEPGSEMDFSGANAIYFWELFYYTPMMVMQRFLQEARFDLAEKWLKYVFSPSGYIVSGIPSLRMWNVRPLEEDTSWNDDPLKSYDPDAVAQNDPMHYKLNAFMRLLDITIGRGDAAYRRLERDTLAESKVWYGRALSLLGEAAWPSTGSAWIAPTLGSAGSDAALIGRIDALSLLAQGTRRSKDIPTAATYSGQLFMPEVNEVMVGYWETLRIRLYNLRHNLTLDGQPLNLPLFAPMADPKALLAAAVAAQGGEDSGLPSVTGIPALRFTPMLESARSMASQLIQFGSTMQQILLSQDAEALAELLVTQGASLAASSVSLQKQSLQELAADRITLETALKTAMIRREHYRTLYEENVNARENLSMDLLTVAQTMSTAIKPLYVAGALTGLAPNVFGLANGGMKYEGPLNAAGIGMEIAANAFQNAGMRIQQEEQYRRRREEWDIQYRMAENEMRGIDAQLSALNVRQTSAQMQIAHMQTQSSHAEAQLALLQGKFSGKAMYSWLRGRLATIFYQYYDLTASLCLMAEKSLQWEKGDMTSYLKTGTWNGAWAGLMAGEGLMLSLAQMEMAWMKHQKRELEVTRTVSLAAFFGDKLSSNDFTQAIQQLVGGGGVGEFGAGLNKLVLTTQGELAIHFSLKDLGVMADYRTRSGRVRSIAVTLPALLGPYQDVRAVLRTNAASETLPVGCNESAISHAMHDNGLFVNDGSADPRWGARWLPFEGMDVTDETGMTLNFTDATGDQKTMLEGLNDVILHIQFTVR